jgi:hypothetical protein
MEYQDLIKTISSQANEQHCIGCNKPTSEINKFWKYVNTTFGLKALCVDCAIKYHVSFD